MPSSLRTALQRLLGSLASRIGFFVFGATLASALAVAGTSAFAVRAFLRGKIEDRIPDAAARTRDRLDLWFAQRTLDVQIFSNSGTVVGGLTRLARSGTSDRAEVEQYLGYVRDDLPIYSTIFALDKAGNELARVGAPPDLDPGLRRHLASVREGVVSGVLVTRAGTHVQVVSAPIKAAAGQRVATLHAVLPLAALERLLVVAAEEGAGRVLLFDEQGGLVATSIEDETAASLNAEVATSEAGEVAEYSAFDGVRVVASALPFARLGWRVVFEGDYGSTFSPIASILRRTVGMNLGIVAVLAGLAFAIARYMLRPLHALSECALRLRDGETDVVLPVVSSQDEVGILTRSFSQMVDSLTRANEALEQLAITDGLTKIHNHRFFQDRLAREIQRSESTGSPLALILLDIDDFKALNDRCGHAAGDGVLEELARILSTRARASDLVARYGGEEFVVLAPGTDLERAVALAESLRIALHEHPFGAPDEPIRVTVSVGVASYRGDRQRFFGDADRALYSAKSAGKDCVVAASL